MVLSRCHDVVTEYFIILNDLEEDNEKMIKSAQIYVETFTRFQHESSHCFSDDKTTNDVHELAVMLNIITISASLH